MSRKPTKWQFQKPIDFKEQVLALPKPVRSKLTWVMTLLSESINPIGFGEKKYTKYGIFYTIRLNDSYRLAYDIVDYENRIIRIYRVGDHRFVYGKD